MKSQSFNNKTCWIVGASSGIGAALVQALSATGANLILSSRNCQQLDQLRSSCADQDRIKILPCDMEQPETLEAIAEKAWTQFQGIDYVFLNAGIAIRDMAINTNLEMVQRVMTVNFISYTVITRALLPRMIERGHGHFVVTSSLCGRFGVPKLAAYSASKHALHGYYESVQAEYGTHGIRATLITSGFVKTNITLNARKGDGTSYGRMQDAVADGIEPSACALEILHAVRKQKREVLVGGFEKYGVLVKRFLPGLHAFAINKHPLKRVRSLVSLGKKMVQKVLCSIGHRTLSEDLQNASA